MINFFAIIGFLTLLVIFIFLFLICFMYWKNEKDFEEKRYLLLEEKARDYIYETRHKHLGEVKINEFAAIMIGFIKENKL